MVSALSISRNAFRCATKILPSYNNSYAASIHTGSICAENIPFTTDIYSVERGKYGTLNNADVNIFKQIVGEGNAITDKHDLQGNNIDWIKTVRGKSSLLLKPRSTEEVSQILKYCNKMSLAVCPQGGNTGLVGGSVPVFDEIILSTQRMRDVISINPISGVLVCQSGCVLEAANNEVAQHGLTIPLDLGAKGSCHLGGNLSTNAGGLRLLRYGSLRGSVLGVEAVSADGTVIDCMSTMRKDNTGYDIKQLLIGSEGTLGVITKLAILCPPKPTSVNLAFLGVSSFEQLMVLLKESRKELGEILSAVEFLDGECMRLVTTYLGLVNPIQQHPFYMLIETSGSNAQHDEEKLSNFLDKIMDEGLSEDGTLASDHTKMLAIWALRERIAEAILYEGYNFKYDMSLPTELMYELVEETRRHLDGKCKSVVGYGHLGDGNIHLNVTFDRFSKEALNLVEPFVYKETSRRGGSISAEHGLGFKKRNYIGYSKNKQVVGMMKQIKMLFDPKNILNPYKTLPDHV